MIFQGTQEFLDAKQYKRYGNVTLPTFCRLRSLPGNVDSKEVDSAMTRSKCPSCEYHEFEAVPVTTKTGQKFCLIQCVACGTVVGAVDDVKVTNIIKNADKKLSKFLENLNRKVVTVCTRKNS